MTSIEFDSEGYIYPYKAIECDLLILEKVFVDGFPEAKRRRWLFENYLEYIHAFQEQVCDDFEQWIDGSFVSHKAAPNDIDLITIVDFDIVEKTPNKILDRFWSFSLENEGIDAYIVKRYPVSHLLFQPYSEMMDRSETRFSGTRPDVNNEKYQKGFLKINFGK